MSDKLVYINDVKNRLNKAYGDGNLLGLDGVLDAISAVDAVEVVRCSQCINNPRIGTKTKGMVWCRKFRNEVRPDDFCSYGERREENAVD